jgi:hypothetical protein
MNLNLVTVSALLLWPVVALWLYSTRPIAQATVWTILGAYLLLPVGAEIKFAMIPELDKSSIPNLAAFLGCWICLRKPVRFWKGFGLPELLIVTLLVSLFITADLNGDLLDYGGVILPGVSLYDGGSAALAQLIAFLPFFLGRQVLRGEADSEQILRALIIAGLAYSLPMLFEVRMSPQLHTWIYGYFPHMMFGQQIRDNGFRPVVFLGHGLLVAFFIMTTAVAAAAFWRTGTRVFRTTLLPNAGITAYLSGVLVMCKTVSSLVYGIFLVPLVRFAKPKMQMRIALALVTLALLYPTLRSSGFVPTERAVELAESVSADRAKSLKDRFDNENILLDHARRRFWFGWGRWGRNRVFDVWGNDISLTDGTWIITIGEFGFVGFMTLFGLLALPVFRVASALRYTRSNNEKVFLAALSLILAINIFDLLPNSPLRPWTWLLAGALLGQAEALQAFARRQRVSWQSNQPPGPIAQPEARTAPGLARRVQSHPAQQ